MVNERFPDNNYYELKYKCDDYTCVVKFNSLLGAEELRNNLKDFLKGCSWSEYCVNDIFNEPDDDIEEDIDEE